LTSQFIVTHQCPAVDEQQKQRCATFSSSILHSPDILHLVVEKLFKSTLTNCPENGRLSGKVIVF